MPSDARINKVLDALAPKITAFENAVATTAEQVRHFLTDQHATIEGHVSHLGAELGVFGTQHLDPIRFAALFDHHPSTNQPAIQMVEKAVSTLDELTKCERDCFVVRVAPGENLREVVAERLAWLGRAFGAARVVRAVRGGQFRLNQHARSLGSFPFAKWNGSERGVAPPIVVTVLGEDLRASSLTEFLDGRQKIVLIVEGPCAPAPLVRVISPSAYIAQVHDAKDLNGFLSSGQAGLAAIVPESAAAFTHDPAGGSAAWERLTIVYMPQQKPRRPFGGLSAAQQAEELQLLESFAAAPAAVAAAPATTKANEEPDPADKLAAWLLTQADLSDEG